MDCRTARSLLDFARARPPELEASEAEALEGHLADCPACSALRRAERQADDRLGAAMRDVRVPDGLRGRILDRLDARVRSRRRWLTGALTAAAAVLLATGLGLYWLGTHPSRVDLETVANAQNVLTTPEAAEAWFAQNFGVRAVAPQEFDYAFLTSCGLGTVQGRRVPQLVFVRGEASAVVYILTSSQFDVQASLTQPPYNTGGLVVATRPHPTDPTVAYLIVYRGGPLDQFLIDVTRIST